MDFVSLKSIQTKIGVGKEKLLIFVLKELVDNALDFIDRSGNVNPVVTVSVKEKEGNKIKVTVANSDFGLVNSGFTETPVKNIFDLAGYYSTKRNQYRITRGALGDALKTVLGIPCALAYDNGIKGWNEPLIIKSDRKVFAVNLDVDKINQTVTSRVEISERAPDDEPLTVVEITLPLVEDLCLSVENYLFGYLCLNTHVSFYFDTKFLGERYYSACQNITLPLRYNPNFTSIHYYSPAKFTELIFGLKNNEMSAYTMVRQMFREGYCMKSIPWSINDLKKDEDKINQLYKVLYSALPSKETIDVPFSINGKQRKEALSTRVSQMLGYDFDVNKNNKIRYKQIHGNYELLDVNVKFPFLFEVMVIETAKINANLFLIEGINGSPNYNILQGEYTNTFTWTRNGKEYQASSIYEMLQYFGYSNNKELSKKKAIVIVNLVSPRIEYKSYGKTVIDFEPFEDAIADTIKKICSNKGRSIKGNSVVGELTLLLQERLNAVVKNPNLKFTDRWTMSSVFYRLRPILISKGMKVNREYITGSIRTVCEENLVDENGEHRPYNRYDLAIIAADRAQLYFDGEWNNVGIDEIEELSKKGSDVLIIEKEGVAEVLSRFADKLGIALLNVRGFVVEYAEMLSQLSKKNGANVAILTDFDIDGLKIARTLSDIYRIGIDFDTLEYFKLKEGDVQEEYAVDNKKKKSMDHVNETYDALKAKGPAPGQDPEIFNENLEYASKMRIEIDSIMVKVGNEPFWNFLVAKLLEKFPKRDYNRSIEVPEFVTPDVVNEFVERIQDKMKEWLKSEYEGEKESLEDFNGMLVDVPGKKQEIVQRFKDIVTKDERLKMILEPLQKLSDEIPKLKLNADAREGGTKSVGHPQH